MALVRIRDVVPLDGTKVRLTLTDGSTIERDLGPLLVGPVFHAIATSRDVFRRVQVKEGTLAWPGDIDLCPDTVIWGGLPPVDLLAAHPSHLQA